MAGDKIDVSIDYYFDNVNICNKKSDGFDDFPGFVAPIINSSTSSVVGNTGVIGIVSISNFDGPLCNWSLYNVKP